MWIGNNPAAKIGILILLRKLIAFIAGPGHIRMKNMTTMDSSSRFSDHTLDKATKAKVTLENYYSNLVTQHGERKQRLAKLEASLKDEGLSESQRQEKRMLHAQKVNTPTNMNNIYFIFSPLFTWLNLVV